MWLTWKSYFYAVSGDTWFCTWLHSDELFILFRKGNVPFHQANCSFWLAGEWSFQSRQHPDEPFLQLTVSVTPQVLTKWPRFVKCTVMGWQPQAGQSWGGVPITPSHCVSPGDSGCLICQKWGHVSSLGEWAVFRATWDARWSPLQHE